MNEDYFRAIRFIDSYKAGHKPKSKHLKYLVPMVAVIALALATTASLLSSYGTIEANIDVAEVIRIDGQPTGSLIFDNFSLMACSTTNLSHNITNLHSTASITVLFNSTEPEGLTAEYWYNDVKLSNNQLTIPPLTTLDFNISYFVWCNANPSEDINVAIAVEFVEAT